jgi:SMI1 / KNR4 family (SUKH-1)
MGPTDADPRLTDLVARLRLRAADSERRTDVTVSRFDAGVRTLDLGGLMGQLGALGGLLRQTVEANREGRVDPESHERALRIQADMTTPASTSLPAPADAASLAAAEGQLGFALPTTLRRIYADVGDGGFGPGTGLFSLARIVDEYRKLRAERYLPRGPQWPEGLLPLVDRDPGFDCIDAASGHIVAWDPESLSERSGERAWRKTFSDVAASLEAWLDGWVDSKTFAEQMAERVAESQLAEARRARERIRAMSPEERAAMGLPAVGWERIVWGGLGCDGTEDEGGSGG